MRSQIEQKFRRRAGARQAFLTQSAAKFAEKTCVYAYVDRFLYIIISHFCENASFQPKISTYVDSPALMRELLKMDIGAAFVPKYTWAKLFGGGMIFRYVSDMPMERFVHLGANEKKYRSAAAKSCHDTIVGYFSEYARQFISPII